MPRYHKAGWRHAHLDRDAVNVLLLRRAGHPALLSKGDATCSLHTCVASAQQLRNGLAELTHGHLWFYLES